MFFRQFHISLNIKKHRYQELILDEKITNLKQFLDHFIYDLALKIDLDYYFL
jgi:hypothetical protein